MRVLHTICLATWLCLILVCVWHTPQMKSQLCQLHVLMWLGFQQSGFYCAVLRLRRLPKQCPKIKEHTNPGFILDTRIFMYMMFMMIYVCIYQWWFSAEYHHRSKPSINHQLASPTTTTTRGRIVQGSLGGSVKPWWKNGCWPISLI